MSDSNKALKEKLLSSRKNGFDRVVAINIMRYTWSHFRFFVKKRESLYNSNSLFNSIYGLWNPDIILILLLHGAGSWLLQAQPDFCDILQYSAADGAALQHDHEPLQLFGCRFPPDVLPSDRTVLHGC